MLSLIVAVSENGVIGRDGDLPWRLSADLQRFKRLTMGAPLVMGRRTWESIGRPLPGRKSIVVTRQADYTTPFPEVCVVHSLADALAAAAEASGEGGETFVIGGEGIYRAALPQAGRLYLTRVKATVEGDARFPALVADQWRLVSSKSVPADNRNQYPVSCEVYERRV